MANLTYSSDLLSDLNISGSSQQAKCTAIIAGVEQFMVTFCNRQFTLATYTKVFPIKSEGVIFLDAWPVQTILRVTLDRVSAMTISSTADVATFATGTVDDVGHLYLYAPAVSADPIDLSFATYTTIGDLATAINGQSGWSATVVSQYSGYPTSDVYPGLSCTAANQGSGLQIWSDQGTAQYQVEPDSGFIRALIGAQWFVNGFDLWGGNSWGEDYGSNSNVALDWQFGIGAWQPYGYWSDVYRRARVVWTGGYSTLPADLLQAEADMVKSIYNGKDGYVVREKLGYHEYELAPLNIDRMPMTARRVLDSYRNRGL